MIYFKGVLECRHSHVFNEFFVILDVWQVKGCTKMHTCCTVHSLSASVVRSFDLLHLKNKLVTVCNPVTQWVDRGSTVTLPGLVLIPIHANKRYGTVDGTWYCKARWIKASTK